MFVLLRLFRCLSCSACFVLLLRPSPRSALFPYTTLFRSVRASPPGGRGRGTGLTQGGSGRPDGGAVGGSVDRPCGSLVDRKSTRLNSSHVAISYAVFCFKKKTRS